MYVKEIYRSTFRADVDASTGSIVNDERDPHAVSSIYASRKVYLAGFPSLHPAITRITGQSSAKLPWQ
ncbi:predicted protein [Plenodomus lingam JN3]|uniref:Predicted protein n=1 Tax=Leptosphaeria maculans (strain JN3 / isolate v23.1.3 / race Av1-4-5-6-7-8) TaxID=985895 RepID=E5A8V2_LEPMJ|nr:predicted protein [Plenodomus lingam JN3]CBY00047.1 predicted protein [Plenodomus lingam JN3]